MRILVTGAYGFIGSHFVKFLKQFTDWKICAMGRASSLNNRRRLNGVIPSEIIEGDITDAATMSGICEGIDYVVHFAAKTFVDHSIVDANPFVQSNVVGTFNLLEQARKYNVKRYIQVSTDEVYGAILEGAYKEDARLNPTNPYAATKAAGDMLALSYFNTYRLPVIVTRNENVYGPFQHRQKVFPTFVRKAIAGEPLPVYGDGKHVRQWIHVEDTCRALLLLLEKGEPGEIYHIAGNQELMNIDLAKQILTAVKGQMMDSDIMYVPDHNIRPGHDRRYALNSEKLRSLGWEPLWALEPGITTTAGWYKANKWWTES